MLEDLTKEVIISGIMLGGSKLVSALFGAIKNSRNKNSTDGAKSKIYSHKTLRTQFYLFLIIGLVSIFVAGKVSGILMWAVLPIGFFAFFFTWAAFEVSLEQSKYFADKGTNNTSENKPDSSTDNTD